VALKWIDVQEIAMALVEIHAGVDPRYVNFFELRAWVMQLPDFDDDPNRCGEKVLEAIQGAWIEEMD